MADHVIYEDNKYKRYKSPCWVFRFKSPSFPRFWHTYPEILYSQQDNVLFEVNGQIHQVNTGDMLFVWPGEPHAILENPDTGADKPIIMQCDADLLVGRPDFQRYAYRFYQIRLLRADENRPLLNKLSQAILLMEQLKDESIPLFEMRSCMLLYGFFIDLWEGTQGAFGERTLKGAVRETAAQRRLADICTYISNHCIEDLSLEAVAEKAGFSKCYFSKIFREYTGASFPVFLSKARLRIAENLLLNESLSITNVAHESGFNSISTFNRVFLKLKGINPSDFRKLFSS